MADIQINCSRISDKEELHRTLAEAMGFPDWYGQNLDALYDCLTDLGEDTHLLLVDWDMLGGWSEPFYETFQDAAADNALFTFTAE